MHGVALPQQLMAIESRTADSQADASAFPRGSLYSDGSDVADLPCTSGRHDVVPELVLSKLNKNLMTKFFILTGLCYIVFLL